MKEIVLDSGIKILKVKLDNNNKKEPRSSDLTTEDYVYIYGEEDLKRRPQLCVPVFATDYAVMCNANLSAEYNESRGKRPSNKLLRSFMPNNSEFVKITGFWGEVDCDEVASRTNVICPVIHVDLESFLKSDYASSITTNKSGQHIVNIGLTFPKSYVGDTLNAKLNQAVKFLPKTGAIYSGFAELDSYKQTEKFDRNAEYKYCGERYVLTKVHRHDSSSYLSNGSLCPLGGNLWVKVEPIIFEINNWDSLPTTVNPKGTGKDNFLELETEEGIISGMPFNTKITRNDNKNLWQNSLVRAWLNGYHLYSEIRDGNGNKNEIVEGQYYNYGDIGFLNEASQSKVPVYTADVEQKNPYDFQFDNLTEDEILKEYIKARVPVFLHGVSGVGKSSRVKAIDPDATRITLRPGMNAEEVDGTLDRETGNYIPPLWYQQICEKCKAEPDKMHVLFIDEITNVKPTVQSLIYSIVLERAGKDGLWPLPENCVVVGAGNETAGNLSAYPLTNALFRRFCHIYYEVDKNEWLKWATGVEKVGRQDYQKKNVIDENDKQNRALIHPSIVAFISSRKDDVLYQELDEEEPKIVTDPRKWEIASNVLYSTQNPNALVPAIGKELTTDFADFVSSITITVKDVISRKFSEAIIDDLDLSHRLSTIAGLTMATEKELPAVREFVSKYFGKELLATFDTMWVRNDPERALILNSIERADMDNPNEESTEPTL